MRYAVFSDVHANLEAFEAVLEIFKNAPIDKYLFAGDIVGYGANPRECIALLKGLNGICIAGNHDWASAGRMSTDYFNEAAREAVVWTQKQISENDRLFLAGLETVAKPDGLCLVHGTLSSPEEFEYMTDGYKAANSFSLLEGTICFVGHTHKPGVFIETDERVFYRQAQDFSLEPAKRYIVNVGSVGQPRDGDPKACFCVYDTTRERVEFRRASYDVATAQRKIREAGLPRILSDRLALGS